MADKLVIRNFSLVGSILSRKHGLATFAHERLEWTLVDQPLEQSETDRLSVYTSQDISLLTSTNRHPRDSHQRASRRSHTPVCMLAIPNASTSTGVTTFPDDESMASGAAANNLELLHTKGDRSHFFDSCSCSRKVTPAPAPELFGSLHSGSWFHSENLKAMSILHHEAK